MHHPCHPDDGRDRRHPAEAGDIPPVDLGEDLGHDRLLAAFDRFGDDMNRLFIEQRIWIVGTHAFVALIVALALQP